MPTIVRTKALLLFVTFLASLFFSSPVKALDYSVAADPLNVALSATTPTAAISLSLEDLYPTSLIQRAELSFLVGGLSAGDILIYDRYSYETAYGAFPLATIYPSAEAMRVLDLTEQTANWHKDASYNRGLIFRLREAGSEQTVSVSELTLNISYDLPDTSKPLLLSGPEAQKLQNGSYRVTATTNEPVTAVLEYGKTINYGLNLSNTEPGTSLQFELSGLQAGITYHYRLTLKDVSGNINVTEDQVFIPQLTENTLGPINTGTNFKLDLNLEPPSQVSAAMVKAGGTVAVQLEWEASDSGNILGYRIMRREKGEPLYKELAQVGASIKSYLDTEVLPGQKLEYQLRSFQGEQESAGREAPLVEIPANEVQESSSGLSDLEQRLMFLGLAASVIALLIYLALKGWQSFVAWLKPPQKKKGLVNIFRDPNGY